MCSSDLLAELGGVAANLIREQLVQRADQVRSDAAKLREEVTARLGATPPWWIDLR